MKHNKFTTPVKIEIPGIGTIESKDLLLKVEVDEAIEEFKAENERLKKCEIWMMQHFYCEEVIACESAKNRRLKRALWLARAERARDKALVFYFAMTESFNLNINGYSNKEKGHTRMRPARWWRNTWLKVERKCRAKAERYK